MTKRSISRPTAACAGQRASAPSRRLRRRGGQVQTDPISRRYFRPGRVSRRKTTGGGISRRSPRRASASAPSWSQATSDPNWPRCDLMTRFTAAFISGLFAWAAEIGSMSRSSWSRCLSRTSVSPPIDDRAEEAAPPDGSRPSLVIAAVASTSAFTSMPMGGWFFLLLGIAHAHARWRPVS